MNKMFKFNGMPYKRSGRAGGKSVSMIGMLVLLLAALLVLPSCDNETTTTTGLTCGAGTEPNTAGDMCVAVAVDPADPATSDCDATATAGVLLPGGAPNDTLCGSEGDDIIAGGGGDDTITGNGGEDNLSGDAGDDTIAGGADDDTIKGGPGEDVLDGGEDDDTINGGPGNDMIDGGEGEDTAVYKRAVEETPLLPVEVNLATGQAEDGFLWQGYHHSRKC